MEENKQSGMKKFAGAEELNTEELFEVTTCYHSPYFISAHFMTALQHCATGNTEADMITHISIPYSDQVHVFLLDSLP